MENLVFLLFAFSAKRKKKPQIGKNKKQKQKKKDLFPCARAHVCMSAL